MRFWRKRKARTPLLVVHSWVVAWDPLGLTTAGEKEVSDSSIEMNAKAQGPEILRLRLGDPDEFPVLDLGYYGTPKRFVVRFIVDEDCEDVKSATHYDTLREALQAVQQAIIATEGWSYWNNNEKSGDPKIEDHLEALPLARCEGGLTSAILEEREDDR